METVGTPCRRGAAGGKEPWEGDLHIRRYLGPTDNLPGKSYGPLANVEDYFDPPLLGRWARLTIMAWDVDNRGGSECYTPEVDYVYFNDVPVRQLWPSNPSILRGHNQAWSVNQFRIPIEFVNFPGEPGQNGNPCPPAYNTVTIEIDATEQCWCVAIGWMMLEIQATSPVVLLHGLGEDKTFWDSDIANFKDGLNVGAFLVDYFDIWPDDPDDPEIPVPLNSPQKIRKEFERIEAELGVDSVHLVAHSKGGLDTLDYLANYWDEDDPVRVLSLTTLSTPLKGCVLADLMVARSKALLPVILDVPVLTSLAVALLGGSDLLEDLTTTSVSTFMEQTVPNLPEGWWHQYNTLGADLDQNANAHVSCSPEDEAESIRVWLGERWLVPGFPGVCEGWRRLVLDSVYRTVRTRRTVVSCNFLGLFVVIDGVHHAVAQPNDILVSLDSAQGPESFRNLVTHSYQIVSPNWKTHASIADDEVGQAIIPWLIETEHRIGDMRPFRSVLVPCID